jgi:hypothetical protein
VLLVDVFKDEVEDRLACVGLRLGLGLDGLFKDTVNRLESKNTDVSIKRMITGLEVAHPQRGGG